MTAALSLLSASALAIALLVPLRDDRRGNRATIGGTAPLRPLFPARDPAPDGGEAVPSAVSIRFAGDVDASAPVEVLSRVVRDAPETTAPTASGDTELDDRANVVARPTSGIAAPAARGGFTFRSLAAALGFHHPADRGPGPLETSVPENDSARHETTALGASASDQERSFAEEVERLSGAPAVSEHDLTVQISAMPVASEAAHLAEPASVVPLATDKLSVRDSLPEAVGRLPGASGLAIPEMIVQVPGADDVRESRARAPVRADARETPATDVPAMQDAAATEASNTGASIRADARSPATKALVTEEAETTEISHSDHVAESEHTDSGDAEVGVAAVDVAPREANAFAASRSQTAPIPIDRMRPPLTRLPLRPKREDISWPLSLSEANGEWSEAARHDFLRRAAERTDPEIERVICAAFREESAAGRLLALRALVRGSAAGTHAIFLEALRRGADEERALAVDVFGERGDREALVEALSDRLDAIAARAALACFGMSSRADLESALTPLVDRARSDAILGLLAGVLQ